MSPRTGAERTTGTVLAPDLLWLDGEFLADRGLEIGEDGRITAIVEGPGRGAAQRLEGIALLPGFVNVHSHAFQRALRGCGERFPKGSGTFWTWRRAMYELVAEMTIERLQEVSLQAFREMRRAGITTVGEFHYLHHCDGERFTGDEAVLAAAHEAGIRIALLQTFYATGGIDEPLDESQEAFATPSATEFWERVDTLDALGDETVTVGVAPHSIRAVALDDILSLHEEARRRGLVLHLHVEEQRREIEESVNRYGRTPMELLLDEIGDLAGVTAIHCTHTEPDRLDRFLERGGRLCVCPTTEANLGDGIPSLGDLSAPATSLSLGSDSNCRISMLEEMRWLEHGQRLATERRGILSGEEGEVAATLIDVATRGGAATLDVGVGELTPGRWADLVAVDLDAPTLEGSTAHNLAASLVFGAAEEVVAGTCVAGEWTWS